MPKTRVQKEETVKILTEKLANAKSVVFADYRGLTMSQLSDLRNKLREVGGEFNITKNTLVQLALDNEQWTNNSQISNVKSQMLIGPTATLIANDDEISPIKLLVKALKEAGIGSIKGGFLGQETLDASEVNRLAQLPTKDELRGQTVGILVAPLQGIVGVLQANLRNLVYALSAIQKSRGGE